MACETECKENKFSQKSVQLFCLILVGSIELEWRALQKDRFIEIP
jgi:hypothetical protein